MLLDEMYGSCLLEIDPSVYGGDKEDIPQPPEEPPEFKSLKTYYLVSKLQDLRTKLNEINIVSDELELVLKFSEQLSYETLVRLVGSLSEVLKLHLQGITNDKEKE